MSGGRKTRLAGGAFVITAVALLGKETVVWGWNQVLNGLSDGLSGNMSLAFVPWQNLIASLFGVLGVVLLLWPSKKKPKVNPYTALWTRGDNVVARIRQQRNDTRWFRFRGGEPIVDVVRDGLSTLLLFGKQGFQIPNFETNQAENIAIGLEHYLSTMIPLLRDGHIETALACASDASAVAVSAANKLKWRIGPVTHTPDSKDRFDRLLSAMAPPSGRKRPSSGQASGEAPDACSSATQTPPDTSEDASR